MYYTEHSSNKVKVKVKVKVKGEGEPIPGNFLGLVSGLQPTKVC